MSSSCRIAGGVERLAATIGKRAETRAASQFHYDEQEMFNAELQKARRENWLSIVANKLRIVRANRYKIDDLPDYKLTPVAVAQPTKAATHADTALGKSWAAAATEFTATQAIKDLRPATIAEENYYKEAFEEPLPPRDADTIDGDPNDMARKPDTKIGRRWWLAASIRDLNTDRSRKRVPTMKPGTTANARSATKGKSRSISSSTSNTGSARKPCRPASTPAATSAWSAGSPCPQSQRRPNPISGTWQTCRRGCLTNMVGSPTTARILAS
jgi:hypothetical protein